MKTPARARRPSTVRGRQPLPKLTATFAISAARKHEFFISMFYDWAHRERFVGILSRSAASHERTGTMLSQIKMFFCDASGAVAVEYVLMATLICVAIVIAVTNLSTQLGTDYSELAQTVK
jgi:Flp pilus assembly pilin Flp